MKNFRQITTIIIFISLILLGTRFANNYFNNKELNESKKYNNEYNNYCSTETIMNQDILTTCIIANIPEQILVRKGYLCSYNEITRNANWVAWHLTKEHTTGPWTRDGIPYIEDSDVYNNSPLNSD